MSDSIGAAGLEGEMIGVKRASSLELKLMEQVRDLEDKNAELIAELGVRVGEVSVLCERFDDKDADLARLTAERDRLKQLVDTAEDFRHQNKCLSHNLGEANRERDAAIQRAERAERVAKLQGAQSAVDDVLKGLRSENESQQLRAIIASVEWMRADYGRALVEACEGGRDGE